jgi:hypothetical protein
MTADGTITTLHSFISSDGPYPTGALIQATDGNFYGLTNNSSGTIFKITPWGTLTVLHNFPTYTSPNAALVQSTNGDFYGTSYVGGTRGSGTVFGLATGLKPFITTVPASGSVGQNVRILGTGLTGATSVTFNGTPAAFAIVSASEITTSVPAGATTGSVQVVTPGDTLLSNVAFLIP